LLGFFIIPIVIWKETSGFSEPIEPLYLFGIPIALMVRGLWAGLIGAFVYPLYDLFSRVTVDGPPEAGHINASAIAQWTKTR
jgi:hypothetical protein